MQALMRLEVNWSLYERRGCHPAQNLLDRIHDRLTAMKQAKSQDSLVAEKHLTSPACTYVYYACGTCPGNGALVEGYCNSSGGSTPDTRFCESC